MSDEALSHGEHESIAGQYVGVEADETYRAYYETAGDGDVPLVCLHTAGGDSRQYRRLLESDRMQDAFTMYAVDIPWHGRTFPPVSTEWWEEPYTLTTDKYAGFVMAFADALDLDRPAVMGCSMGGEIVLELAASYGDEVEAVIGLETTAHIDPDEGYLDEIRGLLSDQRINQEVFRPEWTHGLHAPQIPEERKRETWWIYSQSGPDVYAGDIDFYAEEFDARDALERIDTDECGLYLVSGEYDFSAPPEHTQDVADAVDGAEIRVIDDLGHFPVTEDAERLVDEIEPYISTILDSRE